MTGMETRIMIRAMPMSGRARATISSKLIGLKMNGISLRINGMGKENILCLVGR